jgi:hypothetical protein
MKGLTPYQGKKRCFGIYECMCSNTWASAYSWANTPQMCIECDMWIYPDHQYKLRRKKNKSPTSHIQALCGKCKYTNLPCPMLWEK